MCNETLSIIIPVYQTEKYLCECLDSVIQGVPQGSNVEVLLLDDGSTDKSASICMSYQGKYSFIKYIRKENEGVSATRNAGIRIAKGRYIHFLDSDDFLHPDFVPAVLKCIQDQEFDLCVFEYEDLPQEQNNYSFIRSNREKLFDGNLEKGVEVLRRLVSSTIRLSNVWSMVYRREFLLEKDIVFELDLKSSEDVDFVNCCLLHAENVSYVNTTSVIYRRYREGSATNTYDNAKILCDLKVRKKWFDVSKQIDLQPLSYYPNDFINILLLADIGAESFASVVSYARENNDILNYTTDRKQRLLRAMMLLVGAKKGIIITIMITRLKRKIK